MSSDPHSTHHREQAETDALNWYSEDARRRYGHLTPKQATAIAAKMFETYGPPMPEFPHQMAANIEYLAKYNADMFRTPPTALQALDWRLKQLGTPSEAQKLTEWRNLERASADELLALVPHDAELSADPAPLQEKKVPPPLTDEQRAKGWTPEDAQLAAQSSIDPGSLDPLRRQEARRMVAAQLAPPPRHAIDEALAHIAAGKSWTQLSWGVQRTAFDQAKALGKSLRDFGVDTSK